MTESGRLIYLDHLASTDMHPSALNATVVAMGSLLANPHATEHAAGWRAAEAVDKARAQVAAAMDSDPDEIVFLSGATEADNLALLGCASGTRRRVIVSAIEHKAVLGPAHELARRGYEVVTAPVTGDGAVDMAALGDLMDDRTLLASVMLVNNEIGTVQPVKEIAALCARVGALFHVDAAQGLGWMPIDVHEIGADLISVSAHKMGGPKGVGALFVRRGIRQRLIPSLHGGEQEGGLRPGTLPTPLCVGFGAACEALPPPEEVAEWRNRTRRLEATLRDLRPDAWVNGGRVERHPGSISISFPGLDAERLVALLQPGVAVARGSACTSGYPEPSHVLRAIGLTAAQCDTTLRISTGRSTTDEDVMEAIELFTKAIQELSTAEV